MTLPVGVGITREHRDRKAAQTALVASLMRVYRASRLLLSGTSHVVGAVTVDAGDVLFLREAIDRATPVIERESDC